MKRVGKQQLTVQEERSSRCLLRHRLRGEAYCRPCVLSHVALGDHAYKEAEEADALLKESFQLLAVFRWRCHARPVGVQRESQPSN